MTIEGKAMQLSSVVPLALLGTGGPMPGQMDSLLGQGIGHVAGIGLLGLKIPAIFHNEALNGVVAPNFTAFPTPIGLAATWDPDAVEEMTTSGGARCGRSACSMRWRR